MNSLSLRLNKIRTSKVKELEEATTKQVENNTAFKEAQKPFKLTINLWLTEKAKHEGETTVTVTNDGSTATDGSADQKQESYSNS